jgi:putative transposase
VTQRGNRRERVFFEDADYALYRRLIAAAAKRAGAEVWSYCFMPNHVHLIVTPSDEDGLRATFAEAHHHYTGVVNARFRWTGHLFQGRFGAAAMDETHLIAAARYIALNPVAAALVKRAQEWPWSSARAHLAGEDDELVRVGPLLSRVPNFADMLSGPGDEEIVQRIERALTIGRPLGSQMWLDDLERKLGRKLKAQTRGPKAKSADDDTQTTMFEEYTVTVIRNSTE